MASTPRSLASRASWSWDSWKHAAALATIDPWLAVSSLQSLFDFQGDASFLGGLADGMVTDVVFAWYNVSAGSGGPLTAVWSNTKPPLASWAAAAIAANLPPTAAAAFLR
jgi:putative isomerase